MKAVKRNFLVVEENIRLNEINNFQVSRYFNPSDFNMEDKLNLHFDYSEGENTTEKLKVTAYLAPHFSANSCSKRLL